jgi:anaerobic magnesium-protoporphyrin IX monomethyl ester cyclase
VNYLETADYYKGDPNGGYQSYVWTDHLTADQLVSERDKLEKDVRAILNIPFNPGAPGVRFEHSMGQGLPQNILRTSAVDLKGGSLGKALPTFVSGEETHQGQAAGDRS